MAASAQWAFDRDVPIIRYEIDWSARINRPLYESPPKSPVATTLAKVKNEGGEAAVQQLTPPDAVETGLRSFPTLAAFYSVPRPIAIESFLQKNQQLVGLLFSAFPKIRANWGTEIKPELNIVDDPDGGFPILMVRLTSNMPDAYEALDRFDEEWWLDHIKDAEGLLNFSLHSR